MFCNADNCCVCSNALRVLLYSRLSVMMLTQASRLAAPHTQAMSHRVQPLSQSQLICRLRLVKNLSHSKGWPSFHCDTCCSVIDSDVATFSDVVQ